MFLRYLNQNRFAVSSVVVFFIKNLIMCNFVVVFLFHLFWWGLCERQVGPLKGRLEALLVARFVSRLGFSHREGMVAGSWVILVVSSINYSHGQGLKSSKHASKQITSSLSRYN